MATEFAVNNYRGQDHCPLSQLSKAMTSEVKVDGHNFKGPIRSKSVTSLEVKLAADV
jgi:hypothetical protein